MTRYTLKQLKSMVNEGIIDLTHAKIKDREELMNKEVHLTQIGYSSGIYGCTGKLFKGDTTGQLYVIAGPTSALYIF